MVGSPRRSKPDEHGLPAKAFGQGRARLPRTGAALDPSLWPPRDRSRDRTDPAEVECAIACKNRAYPKYTNCPFCPQFSTPPRVWGPPNSVLRDNTRLYTSGSALGRSLSRNFWAGKFRRHAKRPRVVVHRCHGVSPAKRTQNKGNTEGGDPKTKHGHETELRTGDKTMGGKRNFGTYGV